MKKLVIVHGFPGTGKTTLVRKLSQDTGVLSIGKDTIKEFLFDTLGARDREWSKALGPVSIQTLYIIADTLLAYDGHAIIESAFQHPYARPEVEALLKKQNALCLEIYCKTEETVRQRRFRERIESGERHPGHADEVNLDGNAAGAAERYAPLKLGKYMEVDTTTLSDVEYQRVLDYVSVFLDRTPYEKVQKGIQ